MINIFQSIGAPLVNVLNFIGKIAIFFVCAIFKLFTWPVYLRVMLTQIISIGFYSIPVVSMTAIFSGAVLALQSYNGFARFSAESSIPTVVALSMTRELAPVLAALMVAARVGSSISAEIGTMKVTEQIDALYTLSTDPIKYLVTPRIIAAIISLPILVFIADVIGILGGYIVSIYKLGFNSGAYIDNTFKYLEAFDIQTGLIKALFFGIIISTVSCFYGFAADRGARGVGVATNNSVVISSILILISNYIITQLLI